MSKKLKKAVSVPALLTKEWLAHLIVSGTDAHIGRVLASDGFVSALKNTHKTLPLEDSSLVLSSREMEIALSSHVFLYENFNQKVDDFFLKNYPSTLENAMRLVFKCYLGDDDSGNFHKKPTHPHYQMLLDSIKTEWTDSKFYEDCRSSKECFDALTEEVKRTWLEIKDVSFEAALVVVNSLYVGKFEPYLDRLNEQYDDILRLKNEFLRTASVYLTECRKSINKSLWENESKLKKEMPSYRRLLDDRVLVDKIAAHIDAIEMMQGFRLGFCQSFMYDKMFQPDTNSFDEDDDKLCDLKNRLLSIYYDVRAGVVCSEAGIPLGIPSGVGIQNGSASILFLKEYFGLEKQLLGKDNCYSLQQFIMYKTQKSVECYHEAKDCMAKRKEQTVLSSKTVRNSEEHDVHKLLSVDISDEESPIDIFAYNMLYYGELNVFVMLSFIAGTHEIGYFSLVRRLRKNHNSSEKKEWANELEARIAQLFRDFPAFKDANINTGVPIDRLNGESKSIREGEIDVAIYKDKTLILIEAKSTYGIVMFDERHRHEKHLIHAGHQLTKVRKALQEMPALLHDVTGDENVKFDELKIETMIISTSFEFDGKKFEGHRKLSLLELMILLRNHGYYLVISSPKVQKQCENKLNDIIGLERIVERILERLVKQFNMYSTANPTVSDFFDALNNFNLWEKVKPYWQEKLL